MKRGLRLLALTLLCFGNLCFGSPCVGGLAHAEPRMPARWSNHSALTIAPARLELGVFSQGSYGVSDRLELSTHPLWFFVMPQLHAKYRWLDGARWHLSSSHGVQYPSAFLNLVAKEGTLGLLPATTDVPEALLLRSSALLTARAGYDQWLTAEAGVTLGPRTHDSLLLDFPFLYSRFAALNAPLVPHAALGALGTLVSRLDYAAYTQLHFLLLDEVPGAYSWESELELGWSFSDEVRVAASTRLQLAQFPVGRRWYWFPLVDLRLAW